MLTHRDRLKHSFFLFHPSPWIVETLLVCTLIAVATLLQRRLRVLPPTFSPLQMSKLQQRSHPFDNLTEGDILKCPENGIPKKQNPVAFLARHASPHKCFEVS